MDNGRMARSFLSTFAVVMVGVFVAERVTRPATRLAVELPTWTPPTPTVCIASRYLTEGDTSLVLDVRAFGPDGALVTDSLPVFWFSSDTAIATVRATTGRVVARRMGVAVLTAAITQQAYTQYCVRVLPRPVA
jgi:hypothetical protein